MNMATQNKLNNVKIMFKMKMLPEDYHKLRIAISKVVCDDERAKDLVAYREQLRNDSTVKDPDMRFRWDLLWVASLNSKYINQLYSYLDDRHIDTALKAIVKELGY